jgi:hypothetical protein
MRSDNDIRSDVEERLRLNTRLTPTGIDVDVSRGVVTLTGTVGSEAERDEAELMASRLPGVVAVTNLLKVPPPARLIPTTIEPYVAGIAILAFVGVAALIRAGHAASTSGQWRGLIVAGLCLAGIAWLCKRVCDIMEENVWARWYAALRRKRVVDPTSAAGRSPPAAPPRHSNGHSVGSGA